MPKKEVILVRHAQKNAAGDLAPEGIEAAKKLATTFPQTHEVRSSPTPRVIDTARYVTGREPVVDQRAHYLSVNSPDLNQRLNALTEQAGLTFLQAVYTIDDP